MWNIILCLASTLISTFSLHYRRRIYVTNNNINNREDRKIMFIIFYWVIYFHNLAKRDFLRNLFLRFVYIRKYSRNSILPENGENKFRENIFRKSFFP